MAGKAHARTACQLPAFVLLALNVMTSQTSPQCAPAANEIVAARVQHELQLNAEHPDPQWRTAESTTFCHDWQGKNPDPGRQTQVRVLWSPETLYLRFDCRYRELNLFPDAETNGRRDHLWDRDVAEAFLQPDPSQARYYTEFEIAPNGNWIDLDISPGPLQDLKSGLRRSVFLDERNHTWAAELAIPMQVLTRRFNPKAVWHANFYRIEGLQEPRHYFAWRPTNTPQPNFHVPSAFGRLRFSEPDVRR
jgi:alpha-galactosidase